MSRDAADQARFFAAYAKQYHAGAFAVPMRKDIEAGTVETVDFESHEGRVLLATKLLTRPSQRRDFAGHRVELPAGARIVTDLARSGSMDLPRLDAYDIICAYVEDALVTSSLERQGRERLATQISAAGEIIGLWGREGTARQLPPIETLTVSRLRRSLPEGQLAQAQEELRSLSGWHDDYPFYSDGSWGALSLKGFDPDPQWGVKPSEMSKKWLAANPGSLDRQCDWTRLAKQVPTIVGIVNKIAGATETERVRLLRMAARRPQAHLGRHTDITDRFAGTRDGMVVRLHVPLVTDPRVTMSVWSVNGERNDLHLEAGSVWYLDARKPHSVTNASDIDRVHLVIDLKADEQVRREILSGATW